jgi:hypothetical protein
MITAFAVRVPFDFPPFLHRSAGPSSLHLLDAGHFALETHAAEIAARMHDFLERRLGG